MAKDKPKKTTAEVIPDAQTTEQASDETRSIDTVLDDSDQLDHGDPSDNGQAASPAPAIDTAKRAYVALVVIAESGVIYQPKSVIMLDPERARQIGSHYIKLLDDSEHG